jgi:hypothetical protein
MPGFGIVRESRRNRLLTSLNLVTCIVLGVFSALNSAFAHAQSPATPPQLPDYKYEVASIKPSKAASSRWGGPVEIIVIDHIERPSGN